MRKTLTLAAAALVAFTAATLTAQVTKPAPPPLGPIVSYQYWPTQYIQFITGPELPYTMFMFEADTANAKQPIYHAAFTAKDGSRIHYVNTDALAAYYKATGEQTYKTSFAVESDDTDKVGATTTVRFSTHDEKPVEFRFVQGSDISEQGSGVQPFPNAPIPIFAYRELGALAGEGTALKVGDAVSTAEVWSEYAHPPYFVPYRGAVTSGAHLVVLPKMSLTWTIAAYPAALAAGNAWELDEARGDHVQLKIDKVEGTHYTLSVADRFHPELHKMLYATRTGDTWTTDRLTFAPASKGGDKHTASLTFTPGLTTSATSSTMDLSIAKKQKIATATLATTGDATTVEFTAPAWAAKQSITETSTSSGNTLVLTAK